MLTTTASSVACSSSEDCVSSTLPGRHDAVEGLEHVHKVVSIDQAPIGRNSRSNPATYIGFYDTIRDLLAGHLGVTAALGLMVTKGLIWSIALGSGTSGGVLAPLMIIGGAMGALEARVIPAGDASLWVLISMAAIMGGTMRSPFTAVVFALELTHDLNTLPALLLACVAADAVTVLLMRRSILTEKVARRGLHLTREYGVDPLAVVRTREEMSSSGSLSISFIVCARK